jgi:hypothetical protein
MKRRKPRSNRKGVLLAVPLVWVAVTGLQAVATADSEGGAQADAGTDAAGPGTYSRSGTCSVAGSGGFGTVLGAGCC